MGLEWWLFVDFKMSSVYKHSSASYIDTSELCTLNEIGLGSIECRVRELLKLSGITELGALLENIKQKVLLDTP